jgi:hypothetical protein
VQTLARIVPLASLLGASLALASAASADVYKTECGPPISNALKTNNAEFTTNATKWVLIPAGVVTVDVPAGPDRCIKLLFAASTSCDGSVATDLCDIRASENNEQLRSPSGNNPTFEADHATPRARVFEWWRRVAPGQHKVRIEVRVKNAATTFRLYAWTMDVQVMN